MKEGRTGGSNWSPEPEVPWLSGLELDRTVSVSWQRNCYFLSLFKVKRSGLILIFLTFIIKIY